MIKQKEGCYVTFNITCVRFIQDFNIATAMCDDMYMCYVTIILSVNFNIVHHLKTRTLPWHLVND